MISGERAGFGLSVVGHIGLLALLSLNLMSVRELPKLSEPMDVMLVDKVGLVSAAPQSSPEAPQAAEAPEVGPTTEEAPPPEPTPAPPQPAPAARPSPSPQPVAKPVPPSKAAPAKPAPPAPSKAKPKATSLGTDFLKGIPVEKSTGKGAAPRVATIGAEAMNGLAALIASKVKECYKIPAGGTDTESIISRVRLRLKRDGSIAIDPEVLGNLGVNSTNQPYLRQMNEAALRALRSCAPYQLPPDLYEGGWEDLVLRFNPRQM